MSLEDLFGFGDGELLGPGAAGLDDLDRMRSARPSGTWRFLRLSRAVARLSRGVDIGRKVRGGLTIAWYERVQFQ